MPIQPLNTQTENAYLARTTADTANEQNQADNSPTQPVNTGNTDMFIRSADTMQRQTETQNATYTNTETNGGAIAFSEPPQTQETGAANTEPMNTEPATPGPAENTAPAVQPADQLMQQQQQGNNITETGQVTGLNVVG